MIKPISNVLKMQQSVGIIILKITFIFDVSECHLQFSLIHVLGVLAKQTYSLSWV